MPLQNFVARALPAISAVWLNAVDALKFTIFNDATTKAAARAALELDQGLAFFGTDAGVAGAAVITLSGPITGFVRTTGVKVSFKAIASNPFTATANVNGTGIAAVVNQLGNALTGGELSYPVIIEWTGAAWKIVEGAITPDRARQTVEISTAIIPTDYIYLPGDVRRYGAIGNGVADSTTAFTSAATAYSNSRFADNGTYLVTALNVEGLWGSGKVFLSGSRIYLPRGGEEVNPVKRIIEKLSAIRGDLQQVCLIGDSISDFYYVSSINTHWFSMFRLNVNAWQGGNDFEQITNLDDSNVKSYTLGGGAASYGTTGPLARSIILDPNEWIEVVGDYKFIECFFQRAVGAGSLAFSFNGAAAYKTVSCAGAAANDFNTATVSGYIAAPTGVGTHRITCTGAAVEITGLQRLVGTYVSPGNSQQIRFARIARSGYSTTNFIPTAQLNSIKVVGTSSQPPSTSQRNSLFLIALGTNNMYNVVTSTSPTQYLADLVKIFSILKEAGSIVFISPFEASIPLVTAFTFEEYLSVAKIACDAFDVPFIDLNAYPFAAAGLTIDGLHPNDNGNEKMFEIIMEELAKFTYQSSPVRAGTRQLGDFFSAWSNPGSLSTGTANFGWCSGCVFNGTAFIATHTQATIFQENGGSLLVYHDAGLTPGSTFTPTLVYTLNSTQEKILAAALVLKRIVITYSASMTAVATQGNLFDITATNATAFAINAPTSPLDGQVITFTIRNASGGALGAVTWNAVFKMSAWTQPADTFSRSISFKYNGTNWVQINQTGVDVPN